MRIFVLLPLLIVLGGCSKPEPVVEVKPVEEKQEVKEEVQPEEPVAETKPAEEVPLNPNLKYEIKDYEVTITGCDKKASGELTIPASIEGKPVTSIGKSAFVSCTSLTSITIPDSVTSIGNYAFRNCSSLTTIEVGAGNVNYTGVNGVLFNKEKTTLYTFPAGKTGATYNIPDGVTSIGVNAFRSCTRLTSITIPDSVTSIGNYAFFRCESLTSITIPDGVISIGEIAFSRCRSLTSITIGDGVTSIGDGAFPPLTSLTTIEVGAGNVNYTGVNGVLFNKEKTTLYTYPRGKTGANYTIPDSVTSIGKEAFFYCPSLTSITIPDSVTSIGYGAFWGCTGLTSITIGNGVTSIGDFAFRTSRGLTAVTFLGDAPKAGEKVFYTATPTIYRNPDAKGWGDTFGGRPVKLISEKP